MELQFQIQLTKSQKKAYSLLHNNLCKFLVCRWSRQSGKTVFAELSLIEYLVKPNSYNIYISPTYSQGSKVFKELTNLLNGKGIISKANAGSLTIETVYGSTLQFFSMQSPNSIRGYTVKGILVLDELAFFPDILPDGSDPWSSIIYPIIKANRFTNKVLAISTPKGKRGCFYEFYENANVKHLPGWYEMKASIYDDDLISEEDINMLKQNMSPLAFKEEFGVEFLDSSITFFMGYEKCFTEESYDSDCAQYFGCDWSGSGEDSTVLVQINQKKQVKTYEINGTLDQKYYQISKIINATNNVKRVLAEINGLGAPMWNEVKKLINNKNILYDFTTTNNSKNEILSTLALDISKQDIHFQITDTKLKNQLATFGTSYSKTGKLRLEGLLGTHDDYCMATAFALKAYYDCNVLGVYNFRF